MRLYTRSFEVDGKLCVDLQYGDQFDVLRHGAVFVPWERFADLEPLLRRHVPHYVQQGWTIIERTVWERILTEVDALARRLQSEPEAAAQLVPTLHFWFQAEGNGRWRRWVLQQASLLRALAKWIRACPDRYAAVSIMGI